MPHYYFDVRDGFCRIIDEHGEELPDLSAAVTRAGELASKIGSNALREGAPQHYVTIEIRNKWGAVFETVKVRAALDCSKIARKFDAQGR